MRTNKLISVHIVYNEEEMLEYTALPALKYCDYCVFFDGGPNGPSTDNTSNILNNFKKEYGNKVHIQQGTWGTNDLETNHRNWDRELRNAYCKYVEDNLLEDEEECWMLLWDADETYTFDSMKKIRELINVCNKDGKVMIRYPYINFFYDLNHTVHDHNFSTPCHHLHIFREGFRYWDVSTLMRDEYGICITHYLPDQILYTEDIEFYHYGHCASKEKQKLRNWRYIKRGDLGPEKASKLPDSPDKWTDWKDPREEELKDTNRVKKFEGKHPDHMLEYVENFNKK